MQSLIFYGNCQAAALAAIFGADARLTSRFDVRYLASFDDPTADRNSVTVEHAADAAALFEQRVPTPFPYRAALPSRCATVTFPSIDFNVLWPFTCVNPYNDESPELPWGHFPYGDRVIVDSLAEGLSAGETWQHYQLCAQSRLPDLDELAGHERMRFAEHEMTCDVKISEWAFREFRTEHLFWCANHPTMVPLREMSHRLLDAIGGADAIGGEIALDETIASMPSQGPLALISVPVHPAVASHFDLRWQSDLKGHYGVGERTLSYEQYFLEMIARSIAKRDQPG